MGSKIAKQQSHFTKDYDHKYFRSRVPEMEADADIVVVFGGSNDFGHGDAVIGHMWHRTDDSFYGALHLLYTDLINKYPRATIVIIPPPSPSRRTAGMERNRSQNFSTLRRICRDYQRSCRILQLPRVGLLS